MSRGQWFPSFAAGVAVALVGVGGFVGLRASATGDTGDSTFVPITPCRLVDTRPGDLTVGPRSTPLAADESLSVQVTGTNGRCTIPADAVGVAMNVTAVNPSARTFLTVYPSDADRPDASNLNVVAGQAPTPNKVDVKLSSSGAIRVYNESGTVNLIADVAGYYTRKGLADLQAQIDAKASLTALAAKADQSAVDAKADAADVYTKDEIDALLAGKVDAPTGSQTVFVPASGFSIRRDGTENLGFNQYGVWAEATTVSTSRCLVAPIDLPAGATISELSAGFYVNAGGAATTSLVSVPRRSAQVATSRATATADDTGGTGAIEFTAPAISQPSVAAGQAFSLITCLDNANAEFEYAKVVYGLP